MTSQSEQTPFSGAPKQAHLRGGGCGEMIEDVVLREHKHCARCEQNAVDANLDVCDECLAQESRTNQRFYRMLRNPWLMIYVMIVVIAAVLLGVYLGIAYSWIFLGIAIPVPISIMIYFAIEH